MSNQSELVSFLEDNGYTHLRELEDGTIVGVLELMFTRAIFVGLTRWSWDKRFCFQDRELALIELAKLKTQDDEPSGYIAKRGS